MIRHLEPADAAQFQTVRLRGLRECPTAFASSYDEEAGALVTSLAKRLEPNPNAAILGAFDGADLLAVAGIQREDLNKLAHKAYVWGVYVVPAARRQGVGRKLLTQLLNYAGNELGVRQVNLGVNANNLAALRLYESLGFVVYGTEPGYLMVEGELHDEHLMVCRVA